MISAIFQEMTTIASAFVSFLISLFESVVGVFWTAGSGSDPGQLTIVGTLLLIGAVVGFAMWGLSYIRSLIRVRKA